jgi:hypothetical protein
MKNQKKVEADGVTTKNTECVSRRGLIQSGAAAALFLAVRRTAQGATEPEPQPAPLTNYGPGHPALAPENIFPLFAAWLLFTTDGNYTVDKDLLTCAARIHPDTAEKLAKYFHDKSAQFKPVRALFHDLAKSYSNGEQPYSGGQCPKDPDTVTPIAALLGTKTTVVCTPSGRDAKPAKP